MGSGPGASCFGGAGITSSITGTVQWYAAGGGGGTDSTITILGGSGIGGNGGARAGNNGNPTSGKLL